MTKKYSFKDDYSEGAHPDIIAALSSNNLIQQKPYGEDHYCEQARHLIRQHINNQEADIHFVAGGTLCNLTVIASILRPHESVIAPLSAHIATHETGAIEATGHKVITVNSPHVKLSPDHIAPVLAHHNMEHMVIPRLVCIANTTEIGSIYTHQELKELSVYCRNNDLYLYLDGARLGAALTATDNDMTLADLAALVDIFYIGATKNGALFGEAVVINHDALKPFFRYHMKQRGALLAKSRVLGIQFTTLMEGTLYYELSQHANNMATMLSQAFRNLGCQFLTEPQTNMIFPILPNRVINSLSELYSFYTWQKIDDQHAAIRLVTSWATDEKWVNEFINDVRSLMP